MLKAGTLVVQQDHFIQAILENPDDDAPRLVFADWLEERGDPWGEFIRVHCALAHEESQTGQRHPELSARQAALLNEHPEWVEPLHTLGISLVSPSFHFRRGFIEYLDIDAHLFLYRGTEVFRAAPLLRRVRLEKAAEHMRAWKTCSLLERLISLEFAGDDIDAAGAQALADSPHLIRLTRLSFGSEPPSRHRGCNAIGDGGARALAAAPALAQLTGLDLSFNHIGDAGARALATSPRLAHLTWLDLGDNEITEVGVQSLIDSPYLTGLTDLGLRNNPGSGVPYEYFDDMGFTVGGQLDEAAAARLQARFRQRLRVF
jgi:uncharacterized protein (TIGR02996 family)